MNEISNDGPEMGHPVTAMDLVEPLKMLLKQVYQMQSMFDDEDGEIQRAIEAAQDVLFKVFPMQEEGTQMDVTVPDLVEPLEMLLEQAHQMQPMFDDEDGEIQRAIDAAQKAIDDARADCQDDIERICEQIYGCSIVAAPTETVLWAAERIADKATAQKELERANSIREKHGKPLVYAPYGHHAFGDCPSQKPVSPDLFEPPAEHGQGGAKMH